MVYWITGKSSSGKTVYAKRLKGQLEGIGAKVLLLDGDIVRDQFYNKKYKDTDREKHIMLIANFAAIAEEQDFIVIVSMMSPKKIWRMKARKKFNKSMLIFMPHGELWKGTEYEDPDHEEFMLEG